MTRLYYGTSPELYVFLSLPRIILLIWILRLILKNDISTAVKHYHDLKKNNPNIYNFRENELNRLGYQLLGDAKIDAAIGIFKLNVESYPKSSNVYDSLGESYMKNGQQELAITNYKKSYELDPSNSNAVEMIRVLEEK